MALFTIQHSFLFRALLRMTRQPSPTNDSPTSWSGFKDLARRQYEQGKYEDAVTSYTAALNPELRCPASEQQILLSNLIACRLKIGGTAQARAALDHAKQCIALNPNWGKGYVRLASAYIALGGHSNDACNALQRALSLDPGNATAREMLLRELRRDHAHASTNSSRATTGESGANAPNSGASDRNQGDTSSAQHNQNNNYRYNDDNDNAVVDELTWSERLQFHVGRAMSYYQSQSDDVKTVLKIMFVLLVLYVGFGGRFGLGGETRQLGNYGSNNVYDQYRRHGTTSSSSYDDPHSNTQSSSYPYTGGNNNNQRHHREDHYDDHSSSSSQRRASQHHQNNYYDDDQQYYDARPRRGGGNGWSLAGFRPFDGGMQSLLLLGGLVYAGQRMGMNPLQAMLIVNALGGGRQRFRRPRGFGMGGFGMGGMGRRRRY